MEQVAEDGAFVTVAVSSEITENSVAVPPTSPTPKTVNSAGVHSRLYSDRQYSHVLKNQVNATKEQEQVMLTSDTQTNAVSTEENNDLVSIDSTPGELHDASSLASVVASFSPDIAEQQSYNSTLPGYIELDYSPQAPNHQTQITWEPHSVRSD